MHRIATALLLAILFPSVSAQAADFEDEFLEELFTYIASKRWFNRLPYQGEGVAEIGKLYYLEEPGCPPKLQKWAKSGRESPPLFLYSDGIDLEDNIRLRQEETITLGWDRSGYLAAQLKGALKDRGIEVGQFRRYLSQARVRVTITRRLVPWEVVENYVQKNKKELLSAGMPRQAKGIVIPFQQLVVIDFSYERESIKTSELGAKIFALLQTISSKLNFDTTKLEDRSTQLPQGSTIAYKPYPVHFSCWPGSPWLKTSSF